MSYLFIGSVSILASNSLPTEFDSIELFQDDFISDSDFEYPLMEFSTFLGGSHSDYISDVVLDDMGNIFVAGSTMSPDFPIKNAFQEEHQGGGSDLFIAKFSSNGQSMFFSTFFGGSGRDYLEKISLDPSGNILLSGWTDSSDFPVKNSLDRKFHPNRDVFIAKFSPDGQSLLFCVPIGGNGTEWLRTMLVDSFGNILVLGETSSLDFPMFNPFKDFLNESFIRTDHFVTVLSNDGETILLSSYIGGYWMGTGPRMKLDVFGNLFIYGFTSNSDFPLVNAYDPNFGGGTTDAFVMKISEENKSLEFSTYLGGSGSESITDIAIDNDGNLFVTGITTSVDFPLLNAFDTNYSGSYEGFVTKFSPNGQSIVFSTLLGGSFLERTDIIEMVDKTDIIIGGSTTSENFPYLENNPNTGNETSRDIFLTKISSNGEYLSGYKFGGSGSEGIRFVVMDKYENLYLSGNTGSEDFPIVKSEKFDSFDHEIDYLIKISSDFQDILFSNSFGGSVSQLILDSNESIFISGSTNTPSFPIVNAYDNAFTDNFSKLYFREGFLMKFSYDLDYDGIPNLWEFKYGLQVKVNDASEDIDNDWVSNYAEYLANTDPTNFWSFPLAYPLFPFILNAPMVYFLVSLLGSIGSALLVALSISRYKKIRFTKFMGAPDYQTALKMKKGQFIDYETYRKAQTQNIDHIDEYLFSNELREGLEDDEND
ncbi:MAG: SBBP repeat-containing protein [Candidatus Hodarchaeales archaeon]|jgi:hypothetical protein